MDLGCRIHRLPLLPFEKQLIELLGCSEDEYRRFTEEAQRRSKIRPAEYDLVPDIVNSEAVWIPLVISLVVGAASTALSYLLTPKPKQQEQARRRDLESITGADRFLSTFGFDSQAELANYGEPIPIIFGRYTGETGGMLVSPKLVWSRMFSYGSQQGVKLMFVVGEQGYDGGQTPQGLDVPALPGIFLGNTPLDAVYSSQFAFYWRRNTTLSGTGRILGSVLRYGSRAEPASGDPETFDDVFSCPTAQSDNDTGFSSAHQPSNNNEFGCYASIPNGTGYRVNWQVISIPQISGDQNQNDPKLSLSYQRVKIAGLDGKNVQDFDTNYNQFRAAIREYGMRGLGRNWSRRMGIIAVDGQTATESEGNKLIEVFVASRATFKISGKRLIKTYFADQVNVDDINSALDEQRIAADGALQIGELFMIGRTVWKVTSRSIPEWRPENNNDQIITLECVEITGSTRNRIGVVAYQALDLDFLWDNVPNEYGMGVSYFPLQKVSFGIVRNTRKCEVTEIGLRSRVFQRLNGLCNFQAIPNPEQLREADKGKVTFSTGTTSTFTRRASVFALQVRPADIPAGQSELPPWRPMNQAFVVVGNKPIDQYNFIRIKHAAKARWEFRFVPKNAADLAFFDSDSTTYWQLNANTSIGTPDASLLSVSHSTAYGNFVINAVGKIVNRNTIRGNAELTSDPTVTPQTLENTTPLQVSINNLFPPEANTNVAVTSTAVDGFITVPNAGYNVGVGAAFCFEIFGGFNLYPSLVEGGSEYKVYRHYIGNRWVEVGYTARKDPLPAGHYSNRAYRWQITNHVIVASSNDWAGVTGFDTFVAISATNPFKSVPGFPSFDEIGEMHRITGTNNPTIGRLQGFLEQVLGPARNFTLGQTLSSDLVYSEGSKTITLRISARVEALANHWTNLRSWYSAPTITVVTTSNATTSNWVIGDAFYIYRTLAVGNPFGPSGTVVGVEFVINSVNSNFTVSSEIITADRIFESQSQYGDISHYGPLIEKSHDNQPEHTIVYVNEIVSNDEPPSYDRMTVCGLALKASRNFTSLDQLRTWVPTGIPVIRFHPDDGGNLAINDKARIGPSNLFCDLIYYLLTDEVAGLGRVLGISGTDPQIINTNDLMETAKFLKTNKIFFDGAITTTSNFRQYVSDNAPFFLCNFVVSDGKFSILPALPTNVNGEISFNPIPIKQLFTAGNIVEESFTLEYVQAEERKPFQAVVRYREENPNQLPQERNVVVRWADDNEYVAVESFDLTQFCTNADHAELVGRYFLSLRKRVTHTIRFKTLPYGVSLAPGDYIKVITQANPYNAAKNGTISSTGIITSATQFVDGQYRIFYYKPIDGDPVVATMTVSGGVVTEPTLYDTIFTVDDPTISENVYMVEQITLDEEGLALIAASEFPCDNNRVSLLAQDLSPQSRGLFTIDR